MLGDLQQRYERTTPVRQPAIKPDVTFIFEQTAGRMDKHDRPPYAELVVEPQVLFLDEPTASTDPASIAAMEASIDTPSFHKTPIAGKHLENRDSFPYA